MRQVKLLTNPHETAVIPAKFGKPEHRECSLDIFGMLLEQPKNGSNTTHREMTLVTPILRKINELDYSAEFLLLEEQEWVELCERINSERLPFRINTPDLFEMCDAVLTAPKIPNANLQLVDKPE